MWRKLLLTGLVLSFGLTTVFAANVDQMKAMEMALAKYDAGQRITTAEKQLISDELQLRDAQLAQDNRLTEIADNQVSNSGLRSVLTLGFEDDSDVGSWGVHGGTSGYTTVGWEPFSGVDGSGALIFGDGGYGFYIKRPITAGDGLAYSFSVDVKTTAWADPYELFVTVEGLSTVADTVLISNATAADFVTYTITGTADAGTDGYILFYGSNTLGANTVTIDNLIFDNNVAAATTLSEGFEGGFPPTGWTNVATVETYTWSQSSAYSNTGTFSALFKNSSYDTRTAELTTPRLDLTLSGTDALTFYLRDVAWGSDQDELWVELSTDGGATWDTLAYYGTSIADFTLQTFDLETDIAQTDNAYIKFTATTHYGYGVYIDDVAGPELHVATGVPGIASNPMPADAATGVELDAYLAWSVDQWATGSDLYFGTDNPPTNIENGTDQFATLAYDPMGLEYGTTYYWSVVAYNASGDATGSEVWSFTTVDDPTLIPAFVETMDVVPPVNWTKYAGYIEADATALTSSTSGFILDDYLNTVGLGGSARVNIYGTSRNHWLMTPPIDLGDGSTAYEVFFDLGQTDYSGSGVDVMGEDDRFIFLMSDDGEWGESNIVREWNATSDVIANAGQLVKVDLSAYTGVVQFAFYAESTVSNTDFNVYVDNFGVDEPPSIPIVALNPIEYDFGAMPVGMTGLMDIEVTNNGGADLVITGVTVAAPFSSSYTGTIAPGASDVISVSYDPATTGDFAETMTLSITGEFEGDDEVMLSGSAYPADFVMEDFEGGEFPPFGWTIVDVDGGNAFNPDLSYIDPYSGEVAAEGMGCADDYLITPSLSVPAEGYAMFSFWHGQESTTKENSFEVMVSVTGTAVADFVQIADFPLVNPPAAYSWSMESVDLSAYAGQDIYVAIHVYYSESAYYGFGFDDFLMPPLTPNTNTPFFSEYMEGSSNNKGLEIYNFTGSTISLDEYQIAQSSNGGGWAYYHAFPEGATLEHDDVWLIANDGVFQEVLDLADEILPYPSVVHHNGDDARALIHIVGTDTTFVDVIGIPDEDPGSGWDVAGVAVGTQEHNLVRKPEIVTGNTDWLASAGTNAEDSEWIVLAQNYWYGMGYHNEPYPLPGDNCEMALDFGAVNDPEATGSIESYGAKWYSFTNDGSYDNVFVSLCGSDFDTKVEVWEDCDSTSYIAFNDDFCGTQSEVDLGELPAGDYLVKVYGYSSNYGDYTLNITGTNGVPDFAVTSMEYYGQDTLDVVVTNIGDGDSPGYAGTDYHGLYVNGDYLGYVLEEDVALMAGESFTYTLVGFNYDNLGVGMHEVVFEADTDDDVLEIDETNNNDTLMIEVLYPPLAPRHVMAMAGEGEVFVKWETAVIPAPDVANLRRSLIGIDELKDKPAVVLSQELIDKRNSMRASAFREAGDTCGEAVDIAVADGSTISAPYATYWYSHTPAADGFLTASSDGLATTDTKVYAYDACDAAYIDYDDDGGAGLQSILTIPVTGGTTYYFEWVDTYSSAAFDWSLTYVDYLPSADLEITTMYHMDDAVYAVITNVGDIDASGQSAHWFVNGEDVAYEYTSSLIPTAADTLALYGFNWMNLGAGTFNVAIMADFYNNLLEGDEENNLDSIEIVIEDPDYMPTYNVYRDSVLLAAGLESVNRMFDGEYLDQDVIPETEYAYYITQILEDASESMGSVSAFATPWAPVILPFPYVEDFESNMDHLLPQGWLVEEIGEPDGGNWEIGDSLYFDSNQYNGWHPAGSMGQYLGNDDDGVAITHNSNEIVWTPWFDLTAATEPQVSFGYTVRGGNGGEFMVTDGETVDVFPLEDSPMEWTGALFNLGDYAGSTIRLGFHYDDNGGWAYGMGVDNIVFEEAPLPGTITGMVTDGDGNGIGHANVHAMGMFADEGTMTDATGAYSITVPAGEYQVDVMRVNYLPAMGMATVTEGGSVTLDFTLDMYLPEPMHLMAYPSMEDTTIGLMWAPPLPMGQVAYDDGTYESFGAPTIPTTENNFFATHFKAAISPGYMINEISILSTAEDAESSLDNVSIVGSDEMGGPDLTNVLWTANGHVSAMYPEAAWDFYAVGVTPAMQDFWVVMEWPVGNDNGPYVGVDEDTFVGNSIWAYEADTSGVPMWLMDPGTFAVRAYLGEPTPGRAAVLHGSETVNIEKLGQPRALSVKQEVESLYSVEAPRVTTVGRELLNYNLYRSTDPMVLGDVYATVPGEMFNDDDFDYDMEYFYAVSAVYDLGESDVSNTASFTYWSPLFMNHYEDFMYPDATPLADAGWVTDDGTGNDAANWGIEDEMLHFDWSPTATDFIQTVTSPVANFAGATAARISFYMYLDDFASGDDGTFNITASLSNDGFASESVIFTHNDSIYGDFEEWMVFNISDLVAGTDGWQLRFTCDGVTSFTMDHLWIDDILVESDVYMGPGEFDLLSPADEDNVVITSANVATGSLLFAWESAGENMRYGVELTGSLGTVMIPFDTTATEVLIPYSVLSAAFELAGVTSVEGTWDIFAYGEMGMEYSMNGPFDLTIGSTVGTDDAFIPDVYALYQNYPNPFNPVTTITYDIPEASEVRLVVYNLVGQPVRVLVNGYQNPSRYTLAWNGLSDSGLPVSSGIYIYRLESESFVKTMKMMYLK